MFFVGSIFIAPHLFIRVTPAAAFASTIRPTTTSITQLLPTTI